MAATQTDVFRDPRYFAFWLAETVSGLGSQITFLALQVLVVLTLRGTASDVGLLNASRWLPYLLFGLVVGAYVDRRPRKPVLIASDLGRAFLLGAIPALWFANWLNLPILLAFVALFGLLTLVGDAARQSFVPRLAPASLLAANARLDQGAAAAQTAGPVTAGALIGVLGAPLAVLADAASFVASAALIARIRVTEPPAKRRGETLNLWGEIAGGMRWVYRHRTLAPLALWTHGWFLFNGMAGAVFAPFALLALHLSPFELGWVLAAGGAASLLGAFAAGPIGTRLGAGGAIIACHALMPLAWVIIAAASVNSAHGAAIAMLITGQALFGLALGAENANSLSYRQAVTPDALQSRMNTNMRSINRAMIVFGAPLGGFLADALGYRVILWIVIAGFALVTMLLAASPLRRARHGEALLSP